MYDIIYDVDQLEAAKKSIDDLINTLDSDNLKLSEQLSDLKEEWRTDAGKEFFDNHKDTWTEYVNKYVKKLSGVSEMLQKTIEQYEQIGNEVKNLKV